MRQRILRLSIVLISVLSALALFGCGSASAPDGTSFVLNRDGSVTQTIIGTNDDMIGRNDLSAFIEQQVEAYASGRDESSVELNSCSIEGNRISIELQYASIDDYADFNHVPAYDGDVEEALTKGFLFGSRFLTDSGLEYSGYTIPVEYPEMRVLVLQEPMTVSIPEKAVLYSDNMKKNDDGSYTISDSDVSGIPDIFQTINIEPSYIVYKASD